MFLFLSGWCFLAAPFAPSSAAMSRPSPRYVTVSDAVVLRPPNAAPGFAEAARELARHLELVLGRPVPVREGTPAQWALSGARPFAFILRDSPAPSSWPTGGPTPAGYTVGRRSVWLMPGSEPRGGADAILPAVYTFLRRECGVRWFAPEDAWTVRLTAGPLRLRQTSVRVRPSEAAGRVRVVLEGPSPGTVGGAVRAGLPEELRPASGKEQKRRAAFRTWLRRNGLVGRPATAKAGHTVRLPPDFGLPLTSLAACRGVLGEIRRQLDSGGTVDVVLPSPSWDLSGPTLYALVRGLRRPADPLETWVAEYSLAFGPGAFQVRQYFRWWWDRVTQAVQTHRAEIRAMGWDDPTFGTYRFLGGRLSRTDFVKSAAFLHAAFDGAPGPKARRRLEHLLLAHAHARLIATALRDGIPTAATPDALDTALEAARRLSSFRREFHNELRCCLPCLALRELRAGDAVGTLWRKLFDGVIPLVRLPGEWHFRVDPDGRGTSQGWQRQSWPELAKWPSLRTDRPWEFAGGPAPFPGAGGMAGYDGTGWYATAFDVRPAWRGRPAFLVLGPAEDARTIYVNGKRVLEWKPAAAGIPAPLRIRIDPFFTGEALHQVIVVRVRDSGGPGGLRNPAWICLGPEAKQDNGGKPPTQPSPAGDGSGP